jgi:hypothetical protein
MRSARLLAVFSLGSVFLLTRPAQSLDNCANCACKLMKAWVAVNNNGPDQRPVGLRGPDPNKPNNTIPVPTAPSPAQAAGHLLSSVADAGSISWQTTQYTVYRYNGTPVYDCNVKQGENGNSLRNVTFANDTDWANAVSTDIQGTLALCVSNP